MVVGTQIWSHGELSMYEYSPTSDVFFCTYEWHMKNPEWIRTYNGKYNKALKDAEGNSVKGWVIPTKLRTDFIEALNKREGLKQKLQLKTVGPVEAIDFKAVEPVSEVKAIAVEAVEPLRAEAVGLVEIKTKSVREDIKQKPKAALRARIKQSFSSDEFTNTLDNLMSLISPFVAETFHEKCLGDKLYLSSNSSTLLSTKIETYGEDWEVLLWIETTNGAAAILKKIT